MHGRRRSINFYHKKKERSRRRCGNSKPRLISRQLPVTSSSWTVLVGGEATAPAATGAAFAAACKPFQPALPLRLFLLTGERESSPGTRGARCKLAACVCGRILVVEWVYGINQKTNQKSS